ncbi:putative cellulase [Helianthus debilis subsp. tardiflorus]
MAFTVTMLSWSVIEYGEYIADAGELQHAMEAIKLGIGYFIKAHTSPNVLWAEVYLGMNLNSGELLAVKKVSIVANSASKEKTQYWLFGYIGLCEVDVMELGDKVRSM